MGGGKTLSKKDLESIHVPMAYISGDPTDIAHNNPIPISNTSNRSPSSARGNEALVTAVHITSRTAGSLPASVSHGSNGS
jgi:hypothetical protein